MRKPRFSEAQIVAVLQEGATKDCSADQKPAKLSVGPVGAVTPAHSAAVRVGR